METIHKVIIGSQLHGLANEKSDIDIRGIHISPLKDIISPYKKIKNTSWIEGNVDDTSYELSNFCKYATHGNPNIIEILYSDMIEDTTLMGKLIVDNKLKFLDSTRIYEAFKGYAHNQYKKMNLFEPDARTPKFAVAYLRTMFQGEQLLRTGEFDCRMSGEFKDFLLEVKYNFSPKLVNELSKRFVLLQTKLTESYTKNHNKFKPDIEWIEKMLLEFYT